MSAARTPVWNWTHECVTYPSTIVRARSVDDVIQVVRDPERYPGPVRAHGSNHSVTSCTEADGGTVVELSALNRILEIGPDYVRVEAGALLHDVAREVRRHDLQFFVNTEIGNVTMGAAACASSKDSSMAGEYGQASSYCIGMKVVSPSGELVEITEDDPELFQVARSSFGLLGIVVETTFRLGPLQTLAVEHRVFGLEDFLTALPEFIAEGRSVMWFVFPFERRVMVELRRYTGPADGRLRNRDWFWELRNTFWRDIAPAYNNAVTSTIPLKPLRYALVELGNRTMQVIGRSVHSRATAPPSQIIRYPRTGGFSKYTFCFWAFPEEQYPDRLREYFDWARHYYRAHGYRPNMPAPCYRIAEDRSSLLSYSWDGTVHTTDPSSTADPGWLEFVRAYNEFCSERDGIPLLNQTPELEPHHMRRAFGDRLDRFEEIRRRHDPDERLLSNYFRQFLQP
jgi:FAD/FMN-containing dehydrogenase